MPATHEPLAPRPSALSRSRRHEGGFGVLELVIAMVIVAILMGAVIMSFRGAKATTYRKEALSAGAAYSQAIAQFQADHANRNPAGADFVSATQGPRNLRNQPYMRGVPDGVTGGRISVAIGCTAGGSGTFGAISLCTTAAAPRYDVVVSTRKSPSDPWVTCYLGSSGRVPACKG